MTVERSSLDDASIPDSNDSFTGGSNGAVGDLSMADLKQGYSKDAPAPWTLEWEAGMPMDGYRGLSGAGL